ncbi:MAG: hypothetical protein R3F51_26705 [Cyanobacteriota/Melainabacteria group bacterium]
MVGISTGVALLGFIVAYVMYVAKSWTPNEAIAKIRLLYRISYNKWYIDHFYLWLVNSIFLPAFENVWRVLDSVFVDQVIVNGSSIVTVATGEALRYADRSGTVLCPGHILLGGGARLDRLYLLPVILNF